MYLIITVYDVISMVFDDILLSEAQILAHGYKKSIVDCLWRGKREGIFIDLVFRECCELL